MFRQITKISSTAIPITRNFFSEKRVLFRLLKFPYAIKQIIKNKKTCELLSFIYWEICYWLGLFEKITFTNTPPVLINSFGDKNRILLLENESFRIRISDLQWKMRFQCNGNKNIGCLHSNPCQLVCIDNTDEIVWSKKFSHELLSLHVNSIGTVIVCLANGQIFCSEDNGNSFLNTLTLTHEDCYFRFEFGITETPDGIIIIGEYGNLQKKGRFSSVANIYFSIDNGNSWKFTNHLIKQGVNKHIHLVKYSDIINQLILTDGDNRKKMWCCHQDDLIGHTKEPEIKMFNKKHIRLGGFTSFLEHNNKAIFGTDYNGGTNFIVTTNNYITFNKLVIPDPYRRCPVYALKKRRSQNGIEIWANLHNSTITNSKSLVMVSRDNGQSWIRVFEYCGHNNRVHFVSNSNKIENSIVICITELSNSPGESEKPLITYEITD